MKIFHKAGKSTNFMLPGCYHNSEKMQLPTENDKINIKIVHKMKYRIIWWEDVAEVKALLKLDADQRHSEGGE